MKTRTLVPFLALTFGLTWGLGAMLMLFYDQVVALFGEVNPANPLFILAVYAPGISGLILVLLQDGLRGLGHFLKRLTLWRAPAPWWAFLLLGIPALVYAGAALSGTLSDPFAFSPWYLALPAMVSALLLGPIEELGWRGVALPLLQRRFAPFWAGLVLGGIWAVWHIPAFLMDGAPQSAWAFGPYAIGLVAVSVIMTALFNATQGSLLIAALTHFQIMNPIFPDAQPWDTLMYVAAAAVVVYLNRRSMFRRGAGVTEVLHPEASMPTVAAIPSLQPEL